MEYFTDSICRNLDKIDRYQRRLRYAISALTVALVVLTCVAALVAIRMAWRGYA